MGFVIVKATKAELLEFIDDRQVITTDDLIIPFEYSYDGAKSAIRRLRLLRWIQSELSPDGRTKNWSLTQEGEKMLIYYTERQGGK